MTPEDHLDRLIEHHLHGRSSPTPASDEEAALLAAAAALARLNELEAPPDLAARLEARFRAHWQLWRTTWGSWAPRDRAAKEGGHDS